MKNKKIKKQNGNANGSVKDKTIVFKIKKPKQLYLKRELKKCDFGVAIFGSARVQMNKKVYRTVFDLAKRIGMHGYDLITGGGPGLMEAASAGHNEGDKMRRADLIGLTIKLPFEQSVNQYLELRKDFTTFSARLEHFMALSNVLVVAEGGIGTMLELFFSWQLLQVHHIEFKPIILVGTMWEKLIAWMKKYMLKEGLVGEKDFQYIFLVKDSKEAIKIINKYHRQYVKSGKCNFIPQMHGQTKKPR